MLTNNLKQLAKEEVFSLNRWFRNKYKLSPKDPAFLDCEPWEIELEYTMDEIEHDFDKMGTFCIKCGERLEGNVCPQCGKAGITEKYFDPDFDDYFNKIEKDNVGVDQQLKNIEWEEVPET